MPHRGQPPQHYEKGYTAFLDDLPLSKNPYPPYSPESYQWNKGYHAAREHAAAITASTKK